MSGAVAAVAERLLAARRRGARLTLLFDYDGTLVPYARLPEEAVLPVRGRRLLEALAERPEVALGVLSGRGIDDLRRRVGIAGIYYAGTSGIELSLRGATLLPPGAERAARRIAEAARRIEEEVALYPGAWVERKPLGLAVHYRSVAGVAVPPLREAAERALAPFRGELRLLDGALALEVTPLLGWTKGTAVARIAEHAGGAGDGLLYAGDEANDAEAFEAALGLGGAAVGVGPRAPGSARHRLSGPEELWGLVARIEEGLAG